MKTKHWILLSILTCVAFLSVQTPSIFIKLLKTRGSKISSTKDIAACKSADKIIKQQGDKAKVFAIKNNCNNTICFLVNMQLHSGKARFFIYDMREEKIINAGMVAHGSCNNVFLSAVQFSNEYGCGCTSEGKYLISSKYKGRFGCAYKLKGLETTNSNAFKRFVVLHSYNCVPDVETFPLPICNSLGCTMVSDNFLQKLSKIIDKSSKPILMVVF